MGAAQMIVNVVGAVVVAALTGVLLNLLQLDFGADTNGAISGIAGGMFFMWIMNRKRPE
jgi:membrane associated rhomboid family serine protease